MSGQEGGKGPELIRELVRSGSTRHSYPVLIATVLGFALATFGLATLADGSARIVALVMSAAGTAVGLGLGAFVGRRPDLLRSESHVERMRVLELVADNDVPPGLRERVLSEQAGDARKRTKQIDGDP